MTDSHFVSEPQRGGVAHPAAAGAPLVLDGSAGEGGGQILRTSLSLSALTGRAFRLEKIRAGREKPGLKRQHLAAVRAVAQICGARTEGAELGSMALAFVPGAIRGWTFRFDVGSAGSATLVAQTVLPVLLRAPEPSEVVVTGGTHVPFAPTWDFFAESYLPQLRAMGARVEAECAAFGFYPAGGGEIRLHVAPFRDADARPFALEEAGALRAARVTAVTSGIPAAIAESEADILQEKFPELSLARDVREVESPGPGNAVWVSLEYGRVTAVFSSIGEYDLSRKTVAHRAMNAVRKYLKTGAPVGPHLADQL
ncbi:MAG: RNA 3'-phosphate cyclase, partial [Kiritimatiellae bacterium]|nr:RNA 3'-phosphate cyclase [Kiritimatiellia bacterium]